MWFSDGVEAINFTINKTAEMPDSLEGIVILVEEANDSSEFRLTVSLSSLGNSTSEDSEPELSEDTSLQVDVHIHVPRYFL